MDVEEDRMDPATGDAAPAPAWGLLAPELVPLLSFVAGGERRNVTSSVSPLTRRSAGGVKVAVAAEKLAGVAKPPGLL